MKSRSRKALHKKAKKGMRGYPVATVAHYGPTDKKATKLVVNVVADSADEGHMRKWFSYADIRGDAQVAAEVLDFMREHDVKSVVMPERIIGCPHEEGIDYPEGEICPECPFWRNRDRWTGETIQ